MANNIIDIIKRIKRKIYHFVDLFSGSMTIPYIIRTLNKNIKITCYENNPYLISFYNYIQNNLDEFILKLNIDTFDNKKKRDMVLDIIKYFSL